MKKVRVCFEVQGMTEDEHGNPAPAGMQFTVGEVTDEKYATIDYFGTLGGVKALDLLCELGFKSLASAHIESDFRLISPEEYDREYGDEAAQAGEGGQDG